MTAPTKAELERAVVEFCRAETAAENPFGGYKVAVRVNRARWRLLRLASRIRKSKEKK